MGWGNVLGDERRCHELRTRSRRSTFHDRFRLRILHDRVRRPAHHQKCWFRALTDWSRCHSSTGWRRALHDRGVCVINLGGKCGSVGHGRRCSASDQEADPRLVQHIWYKEVDTMQFRAAWEIVGMTTCCPCHTEVSSNAPRFLR